MSFFRRISDNVVSAVVAAVIIAVAAFIWEQSRNGALISALHGVTKSELDDRLKQIGLLDLDGFPDAINSHMTLECNNKWEQVGREKSHEQNNGDWCPDGHFVNEFDLNLGGGTYVAYARCCKLMFK